MESKRTARQSGFELVRIIAMFLIVANHLANHGIFKVTSEDIYALWPEMSPFNQAAGALISCGGRIGVAVFFMLTGYFMVERDKLSPKSAVNFLWRVHFFAAAMFAIVVILRAATGLGADINMPLAARKSFCTPLTIWWFALAYFVLLFLAPSINIFVRSMRGRGAVFLLILYLWYFFYLGGNVSSSYDDYIKAIFFYLIGAFVRIMETKPSGTIQAHADPAESSLQHFSASAAGLAVHTILFLCAFLLSGYLMYDVIQDMTGGTSVLGNILIWTPEEFINNVMIPVDGLLLLLIGRIRFSSRIVNYIASCTFGVYLIHEYAFTRKILWHDLLRADTFQYKSRFFILYAFLDVAVIFLAGIILETIRLKIGTLFQRKLNQKGRL